MNNIKQQSRKMIATNNIPKNTILFEEEIKFMIDRSYDNWYIQLMEYELNTNYEKFIDLFPHSYDKYIISDIIYQKHSTNIDPVLAYNKIIRNAFNVHIDNKHYAAILYKGRMFNHSCCPNVLFEIVKKNDKLYMKFFTGTNVKKGDELCDNYFDVNLSYKKRQEIAKTFYGFECKCRKCNK